jgi:hypothetical protein
MLLEGIKLSWLGVVLLNTLCNSYGYIYGQVSLRWRCLQGSFFPRLDLCVSSHICIPVMRQYYTTYGHGIIVSPSRDVLSGGRATGTGSNLKSRAFLKSKSVSPSDTFFALFGPLSNGTGSPDFPCSQEWAD